MTISGQAGQQIHLVVFDLDGTLVDSKKDLALSVNAMREQMGLVPLPFELIASYVGHGVTALVTRALGDLASQENVQKGLAYFLEYYRQHMLDNTRMYPGVPEALEELRNRKLAVLTNKPVRFSQEMLTRLGIAQRFAYIYGGNSFPQKKPDPMGLHKLMADLQASPRQTLIVGDSDTDVLTGRNAGVWTCGVTYGFGASSLQEAPPDVLLDDLRELPPLLDGQPRAR
ncbi:MAG: phosphoglycolate phosphatase [Acidobacteriia bacterium]|nr:phosphoglycolate phosphatase [Terriglobia bacterium]